jgi:AraC family transcriptional regulator of adaptative response/methylated-DNA-[protein]-cysteine methyltransferase
MNEALCWQAVTERDKAKDGLFYYGVLTTGVYCRPSCGSRRPLRKNVRFYERTQDAQKDGLRACLRCRPDEPRETDPMLERVRKLCRYIEAHPEENLRLATLARETGASPFHLQRSFKAIVGVTPKDYAESCRIGALKRGLREDRSVTQAIYNAGYGSSSRVYERADTRLGMTPRQYREGGAGVEISYAVSDTPLGMLMMAATDRGLCSVQFGAGKAAMLERLRKEFPQAVIAAMRPVRSAEFARWMRMLSEYLQGSVERLDLPLDIRGTAFQMKVWNYLQRIPYGSVRSYTEVAKAIGKPAAVRAVAGACASNRVALVIPCHRVIRGDGGLGGFRWGLDRMRTLIDRERVVKAASRLKGLATSIGTWPVAGLQSESGSSNVPAANQFPSTPPVALRISSAGVLQGLGGSGLSVPRILKSPPVLMSAAGEVKASAPQKRVAATWRTAPTVPMASDPPSTSPSPRPEILPSCLTLTFSS